MFTLRKPESEKKYQEEKKSVSVCPFCTEEAIHSWKNWSLVPNRYPYDLVANKHDLLILKAHRSEPNKEELTEFEEIKKMKFTSEYHCLIENFAQRQSVPGHFHIHILRYKE